MRMRVLKILTVAGLVLSLAACQDEPPHDGEGYGYGLSGFDPAQVETQKAACEARGGEFRPGGLGGLMTCFETPKDAGKSCTSSGDCSTGQCLARSRTCAPIKPLFGCNDLLDAEGRRVSLCVD